MNYYIYFFIFIGCFAVCAISTGLLINFLKKRQIVDQPNSRSNHSKAIPRGGGVAVCLAIALAFFLLCIIQEGDFTYLWPLFAAAIAIAAISAIDDVKNIGALIRFSVHILVVAAGMIVVSDYGRLELTPTLTFLPKWVVYFAMAVIWLWFINLYNFMDGIDGITGSQTVFIGVGIVISIFLLNLPFNAAFYAAMIVASALGFLIWNWHPAKIFIGDVGSITLGFLLGWLLLYLATRGGLAPALIIPAYYVSDSTVTILKRLLQGKKIWQAHSEHFYQQAVRRGLSHSKVVGHIMLMNTVLIALAIASILYSEFAYGFIAVAYLLCFGFLYLLANTKNAKTAQ